MRRDKHVLSPPILLQGWRRARLPSTAILHTHIRRCVCVHTHIHTCKQIYSHTYIQTDTPMYMDICVHTHIHVHTNASIYILQRHTLLTGQVSVFLGSYTLQQAVGVILETQVGSSPQWSVIWARIENAMFPWVLLTHLFCTLKTLCLYYGNVYVFFGHYLSLQHLLTLLTNTLISYHLSYCIEMNLCCVCVCVVMNCFIYNLQLSQPVTLPRITT